MDTQTHEKFAAALMKNAGARSVNMKLIKNINHDIDNSPAYVLAMSSFFNKQNKLNSNKFVNNPYDFFHIAGSAAHRQHGHDMLQGMFIAMQNSRALGLPASRGVLPVIAHYMADNLSNKMAARMGTEGRNLFQALYNWQTRRNQMNSLF